MAGFFSRLFKKRASRKAEESEPKSQQMESLSPSEREQSDDQGELLDVSQVERCQAKRGSVSAEVYGEHNKREDFVAPVHPKSDEQKVRIAGAVSNCFLFNCLEKTEEEVLIGAFQEEAVAKGTTLLQEGADGHTMYLVESGEFEVSKIKNGEPLVLTTMVAGEAVGELALMYNAPRAATVVATQDAVVWALDRATFNHVVRDAAALRRERWESFLANVEILKDMDAYERSRLGDALKPETFAEGTTIVKEGEPGDVFYILESGEAAASKGEAQIMKYKAGDYFGELVLLKSQPRAATVTAVTECHCLSLERRAFKRLLGPAEEILRRNAERYRRYSE